MFAPKVLQTHNKQKGSASKIAGPRSNGIQSRPALNSTKQMMLLPRATGNQAMLRLLGRQSASVVQYQQILRPGVIPFRGVIQRKLKIGAVNDPLEAEADRVADQVMRMPEPGTSDRTNHRQRLSRSPKKVLMRGRLPEVSR